ncbi:nuclear transport factor 2 family protein [Paenibacillus medicaginis]|uniref:Nuclear transport factor 2 family protein n=1 Tax=Paenibacillus medicaginis TaxID=1470560 RepID=A0ABV5C1B2_9BACL
MDDTGKKKIIEHFLSHYGQGRWGDPQNTEPLNALLDMLTDDVEWWMSGLPHPGFITKDEFRSMLTPLDDITDGPLQIVPTGWTIQGDRVAVEAYSTMKLKSGRRYQNHYHFLFELRGDKIAVYHEHHDTAHVNDVLVNIMGDAEK